LLDKLERKRNEANTLYMKGNYEGSLERMKEALEGLVGITSKSTELRGKALFWVYLTEYLAVSGTSMICGFFLWLLMVRRHFYKDLETTRLAHVEE